MGIRLTLMDVLKIVRLNQIILVKEFHQYVTNAGMGNYFLERLVMLDLRRDVSLIVWARWTGMTVFLGMRQAHRYVPSVFKLSSQSSLCQLQLQQPLLSPLSQLASNF